MKEWAKDYFMCMTEEEREEFMNGLPKEVIWKMAEGNAHQSADTTIKGTLSIQFDSVFNDEKTDTPV